MSYRNTECARRCRTSIRVLACCCAHIVCSFQARAVRHAVVEQRALTSICHIKILEHGCNLLRDSPIGGRDLELQQVDLHFKLILPSRLRCSPQHTASSSRGPSDLANLLRLHMWGVRTARLWMSACNAWSLHMQQSGTADAEQTTWIRHLMAAIGLVLCEAWASNLQAG